MSELDPSLQAYYATLWVDALLAATDAVADPFPAELEQLAAQYFERFPPRTKA